MANKKYTFVVEVFSEIEGVEVSKHEVKDLIEDAIKNEGLEGHANVFSDNKNLDRLLDLSSEFLVAVRSWNLHETLLKTRDADTGKPVDGWSGTELERFIWKLRNL